MRVDYARFLRIFVVLVALDAIGFLAVFAPRPAITAEGWLFLERQRPATTGSSFEMFLCSDCLNLALLRRPFGGWESLSGRVLQLVNLPAFSAAEEVFMNLQHASHGSSRSNSDVATAVLLGVAVLQCGAVAALLSVRRRVAIARAQA